VAALQALAGGPVLELLEEGDELRPDALETGGLPGGAVAECRNRLVQPATALLPTG
jgi:hypothetical protein